jgi:hypothetical protein
MGSILPCCLPLKQRGKPGLILQHMVVKNRQPDLRGTMPYWLHEIHKAINPVFQTKKAESMQDSALN